MFAAAKMNKILAV